MPIIEKDLSIVTYKIRRQLTLFVDQSASQTIERVRQAYNPKQFELIKSHVTLCREDEIKNLEQVISNLLSLSHTEVVIEFGNIVRFDNGKGLILPATNDHDAFQELRRKILAGLNNNPKKQEPHITLMHPRNSTCTDEIFEIIQKIDFPAKLNFKSISLIEQKDAGRWDVLRDFVFNQDV